MLLCYTCPRCGNEVKKITKEWRSAPRIIPCANCGGFLELNIDPPSTSLLEDVDDGTSDRTITIRKDIKQRMRERQDNYLKELENRERPFGNVFDEKEE